ncbi:MAG: hypothetical protein J2P57_06525 [Acidimicrobiaceae bacterium]|nr:hypothetical protein [Acidimicrobiaceae bacterium]
MAEVARRLEADFDFFVSRFEQQLLARIQKTRSEPSAALQQALRTGVVAGVRDVLARLRSDGKMPEELPPELISLARIPRELRCELPGLADVWLVGQDVFWDCFATMAEQTLDDPTLCWDVVKAARAHLHGHAARMYELFQLAGRGRLATAMRLNDSSLAGAVARALRGVWVEPGELGYDLTNNHLAVVADTASSLDGLVERTGRQLLQVLAPDAGVWAWLGGQTQLSDAAIDDLIGWQRSRQGFVSFGEPAQGVAGFSASHAQALEASAIADATGQSVVRYADVRLLSAVLRDGRLAKEFVERELGELDRSNERMSELRATLRVYLEQGQSVSTTAVLRQRDRKTIQRQLRSAERLMRHYVHDRSGELLIALQAGDILRRREPPAKAHAG